MRRFSLYAERCCLLEVDLAHSRSGAVEQDLQARDAWAKDWQAVGCQARHSLESDYPTGDCLVADLPEGVREPDCSLDGLQEACTARPLPLRRRLLGHGSRPVSV